MNNLNNFLEQSNANNITSNRIYRVDHECLLYVFSCGGFVKKYPLDLENCGGDVYVLISKGHHDLNEFGLKVLEHYNHFMPMEKPQHIYMKAIPTREGYEFNWTPANKETRGAFPVTYSQETNMKDSEAIEFYKALGFIPKWELK